MTGSTIDTDRLDEDSPPETVMIVEPDVLVRLVVAEYLRNCGYQVIEASMAEEVLAVLEAGPQIDIILTEIELPGARNGFALSAYLRDRHPQIVVLLTAGAARLAEQATKLCGERPVRRPYQPQEVLRRIHALRRRGRPGLEGGWTRPQAGV